MIPTRPAIPLSVYELERSPPHCSMGEMAQGWEKQQVAQLALLGKGEARTITEEEIAHAITMRALSNTSSPAQRVHTAICMQAIAPTDRLFTMRKFDAPVNAQAPLSLSSASVLQHSSLEKAREPIDSTLSERSVNRSSKTSDAMRVQQHNRKHSGVLSGASPAVPSKNADIKRFAATDAPERKRQKSAQSNQHRHDNAERISQGVLDTEPDSENKVNANASDTHGASTAGVSAAPTIPTFHTAADQLNGEKKGAPSSDQQRNPSKPFHCPTGGGNNTLGKAGQHFNRTGGGTKQNGGQQQQQQNNGSDSEEEFSADALMKLCPNGGPVPESVKKLEKHLVERVCAEICDRPQNISWTHIAGLEHVKSAVQEIAVWPMLKPHLFTGARAVPRGMLLFGPPGTGKTLIGRAVASQCAATFFSISSSSLTSKWIGEAEKLVRTLFTIAIAVQPSVVFVDEIDSILSARKSEGEHESSRRLKTELMVQMEGISGDDAHQVLLIGATNRPQEMDDAARRRMPKQLHVPLPCAKARRVIVNHTLKNTKINLSEEQLHKLCEKTEGYSASDMKHLVQEAARAPLREVLAQSSDPSSADLGEESIRPVSLVDFKKASKQVRPTVTEEEIKFHEEWDRLHGARALEPGGFLGNDADGANDEDDDDWGV